MLDLGGYFMRGVPYLEYRSEVADELGLFCLDVPPGPVVLHAGAQGLAPAAAMIEVSAGETAINM